MNSGFEKNVNIKIFSASFDEICFFSIKSSMYFALLGNPVIILMKNMKDASSFDLNNRFIVFFVTFPNTFGISISINNEEMMNIGNSEGNMLFMNRFMLKFIMLDK